jgi:hypothetical protein
MTEVCHAGPDAKAHLPQRSLKQLDPAAWVSNAMGGSGQGVYSSSYSGPSGQYSTIGSWGPGGEEQIIDNNGQVTIIDPPPPPDAGGQSNPILFSLSSSSSPVQTQR